MQSLFFKHSFTSAVDPVLLTIKSTETLKAVINLPLLINNYENSEDVLTLKTISKNSKIYTFSGIFS